MANRWDAQEYLVIVGVSVQDDKLQVTFANEDVVQVAFSAITPSKAEFVDWEKAFVSADALHVTAPGKPKEIEIPWHVIRRLTDSQFARHMADCALNQARHIGARLRELRNRRGLSQAKVAAAAGIEPANLSRIENGRYDLSTSTLWKLLAAMGYSPADLATSEVEAELAAKP